MKQPEELVRQMTLEEKASLCSGEDFWHTKAVERLGIPQIMMSDGPHGLRTQKERVDQLGINESIEAICFPTGCALASSFDPKVMACLGENLAAEAQSEGVHTVLGPAVNIKRSPLCGRNFEYLSEDPLAAGKMAASYVKAMQAKGTGVSLKHFAANNQELCRMRVDEHISGRALREIYLANFEKVVKEASPWTIMCSYNRINGTYSSENTWLLTQVLRKEWGYTGIVMTDWGAMNRRTIALKAGLDLEMPSSHGETDKQIVKAVREGKLDEAFVDQTVVRMLAYIQKCLEGMPKETSPYDKNAHSELSGKLEEECAVLLKNKNNLLPLKKGMKLAVIGEFAKKPRYQGGGSSHIHSTKVVGALEAFDAMDIPYTYAKGFPYDEDKEDEKLFEEAINAAKDADIAIIFAGLPESFESEGFDRKDMELPACQNQLIARIAAVQPNIAVVLHNGSPVTIPWLDKVSSILEMYLGGQQVGTATVNLLTGKANPSGRLSETFPVRLEDTPCYLTYPGNGRTALYGEDIFVGYRYYEKKGIAVNFPFGFGLSYTTFTLSDLVLSNEEITDKDSLTVQVKIKNTGNRLGKEVVQLYVANPKDGEELRPLKELRDFAKVELKPQEEKTVAFTLGKRAFAYWEERLHDWYVPEGTYTICIGTSSKDIALQKKIHIKATTAIPFKVADTTTCADVWNYASNSGLLDDLLRRHGKDPTDPQEKATWVDMPLHSIVSFLPVSMEEIDELIQKLH
ncbi:MAG: glycoside hydrolase family 3 C-terminal domain-containing protein [Spirochaetia bacterium]|jgi:beta-glucosidase|nr:glycoside hydrolase family 3 C-terminal domain-containing protein [Spirochaetia bacterium]